MIFILAGNVAQAEQYRRDQKIHYGVARIITSVRDVRGLGPSSDVRYVGHWRDQDPDLLHVLWLGVTKGGRIAYDDWLMDADKDHPMGSATQADFVLITADTKDLSRLSEDLLIRLADIHSGVSIPEDSLRGLLAALYHCPNKAADRAAKSFVPDLLL